MNRILQVASVFAAIVMVGSAAQAQFRMRPPQMSGIWNPVVGAGADYEVDRGNGNGKTTLEVAIVGKDSVNGKDAYWMEMSFTPPSGSGEMMMKSLYSRDGDDLVISHYIMQMAGRPPMELS